MKVKFNEDYTDGDKKTFKKGETYDVPDQNRAMTYVRSGMASRVAQTPPRHPQPAPAAADKPKTPAAADKPKK